MPRTGRKCFFKARACSPGADRHQVCPASCAMENFDVVDRFSSAQTVQSETRMHAQQRKADHRPACQLILCPACKQGCAASKDWVVRAAYRRLVASTASQHG